jgi:F0F1-type ATP synthase assembly protein I
MTDQSPNHWVKSLGLLSVMVTDIGAGVFIGYLVWAKLGAPWWTLLLASIAGLVSALYRAYRLGQQQEEKP